MQFRTAVALALAGVAFSTKWTFAVAQSQVQGVGFTFASGVSDDGRVVAGYDLEQAWRWTREGGPMPLGRPGASRSIGRDVSSDGSIILGTLDKSVEDNTILQPFLWTEAHGLQVLGEDVFGEARGLSGDGSTVAGWGQYAWRWTAGEGEQMLGGGNVLRYHRSQGFATSSDGSVVVGTGIVEIGAGEAFRWTQQTGMRGLGLLTGGTDSNATAVSPDGRVVVGNAQSVNGREAFRWEDGVMVGLGDLPGGLFSSFAQGVSGDGKIVVGGGRTEQGFEAFFWDAAHGMRRFEDALASDYGIGSGGWVFHTVNDVSADGTVFAGDGINPSGRREGWVVIVPEPSALVAVGIVFAVFAIRRTRRASIVNS
jgi:probable HAF family extracellular repeat protein